MKKLKLVLPFLAILFLQNIQAQDEEITHTFHSEAFGKDRNIYVYLPDRYFEDTTAQFSVAYILDGHYLPDRYVQPHYRRFPNLFRLQFFLPVNEDA